MVESNFQALDINMVDVLEEIEESDAPVIEETFLNSPWYANIIYVLLYLNTPPSLSKTKARFLKQKSLSFCILDGVLYWKNVVGILLKCLLEDDAGKIMHEFHDGECGGHLYWKATANKILRSGCYWPTLFPNTQNLVMSCHKCQIFDGKRKLLPLPLHPINVETPFSLEKFTHLHQPNKSGS